jgi:hypothetical protein
MCEENDNISLMLPSQRFISTSSLWSEVKYNINSVLIFRCIIFLDLFLIFTRGIHNVIINLLYLGKSFCVRAIQCLNYIKF